MNHDSNTDEPIDAAEDDRLELYDLNGDGQVGLVEDARATLGIVDAHLEQVAEEGGVKGKIADVAHLVVDKLDND